MFRSSAVKHEHVSTTKQSPETIICRVITGALNKQNCIV